MDSRTLLFVVIFGSFGVFTNFVISNPIEIPNEDTESSIIKVLLDCIHSNSETYRGCLIRQKRHHHSHEIDHSCMEPCIGTCIQEKRYEPDSCADTCKYCIKRQNHRKIDISETSYETVCVNNNCTTVKSGVDKTPVTVNVTAHVHIHSHYSTQTAKQSCPCYYPTWQPCPCRPSYPVCQFPNQWPCIPDMPHPPSIGPPMIGPPMIGPPMVGPPMVGPPMVGPPMVGPPMVGPAMIGPPSIGSACVNSDCNPVSGDF